MKVKIFRSSSMEILEKSINEWAGENREVFHINDVKFQVDHYATRYDKNGTPVVEKEYFYAMVIYS